MFSKIREAVTPIVPDCLPDSYDGAESVYCTFNYTEIPALFADDAATETKYLVQLHLFLPPGRNPIALKKRIRAALSAAEFTTPQITASNDKDGQHYIFECEYAGDED